MKTTRVSWLSGWRQMLSRTLAVTTVLGTGLLMTAPEASADIEQFDFYVFQDGIADVTAGPDPDFAGNNPGEDALNGGSDRTGDGVPDPGNGIVRTLDRVIYEGVYSADFNGSGPFTMSFTIDANQEWVNLNRQFDCPGASLSADGRTITCVVNSASASETGAVQVRAIVQGDNAHGDTIEASAVLEHDSVTATNPVTTLPFNDATVGGVAVDQDPDDDGTIELRVSAKPIVDLVKNNAAIAPISNVGNGPQIVYGPGPTGTQEGVAYVFPLSMLVQGGVGSEQLQNTINITDDISGISANAELYNWGGNIQGCGPNYDPNDTNELVELNDIPEGIGVTTPPTPGPLPTNSVTDSGTWSCTQSGSNIDITITGADTTGNHRPSTNARGGSLNATDSWLVTGGVAIWIPLDDIPLYNISEPNRGGELDVTNRYEPLTTNSISNIANEEPETDNNQDTFKIFRPRPGGYIEKFYRNVFDPSSADPNINNYWQILYPMTQRRSGDGVVVPGQVFSAALNMGNNGDGALADIVMCEAVDNLTQRVADPSLHSNFSNFVEVFDNGGTDVVIEYGTGGTASYINSLGQTIQYYASYADQDKATCENLDSPGGWHTDPNSVPGGLEAITRVRVYPQKTASDAPTARFGTLPENGTIRVALHLEALARDPRDGTLYTTDGTHILPNHMTWSTPTIPWISELTTTDTNGADTDGWLSDDYDPVTHSGDNDGDRLTLISAITRVEKTVNNGNEQTTAVAGDQLQFELQPSLTAFSANPPTATLLVEDILPPQLVYVLGSASRPPVSVAPHPDQTTYPGYTLVKWNLGLVDPNISLSPITFEVTARPDNSAGSGVTNEATIIGYDRNGDQVDNSSEDLRTDDARVNFSNTAKFRIFKQAPNPLVELDLLNADDNNASLINTDGTIDIVYDLFFSNLTRRTIAATDFIDILPYNGDSGASPDGRTPKPSNFAGDVIFDSISEVDAAGNPITTNGFTFLYTSESRANLNQDPTDSSNDLTTGSTQWCTSADFGTAGCPGSNADVTAVRIQMTAVPGLAPTRQVRLTLKGSDIQGNDTYTNDFSGEPPGLQLITSNDALVKTVARPGLVLVKRLTAVNGVPITTVVNDIYDDIATPADEAEFDDHPYWPAGFLQGDIERDDIEPGDDLQYTIYFMSNGFGELTNLNLCDMVPQYTSYLPGTMSLTLGTSGFPLPLTDLPDTDGGRFFSPGFMPTVPCPQLVNNQGAVVFNLVNNPSTLPAATNIGTPANAFGFVRFEVKVD
ncbi:MAG: hypothetical protein AAGA46_16320 [Cyanobacteria bacterium P01_F01_bin.13]